MRSTGRQYPLLRPLGLCVPVLLVLFVLGCSSGPTQYEGAFSVGQQLKGNAESIPAPMDVTWGGSAQGPLTTGLSRPAGRF